MAISIATANVGSKPKRFGPVMLLLFGALGLLASIGAPGALAGSLVLLAAGTVWWWLRSTRHAVQRAEHDEWAAQAKARATEIAQLPELPVIAAPFALQKGEVCHWAAPAAWYELRAQRKASYSGLSYSIPIAKGLRYRVGTINLEGGRKELRRLDSGMLYLTNKRVFFDGQEKNTSLPYRSVAGVSIERFGLVLERQSGKSIHLEFSHDSPGAGVIIARHLGS